MRQTPVRPTSTSGCAVLKGASNRYRNEQVNTKLGRKNYDYQLDGISERYGRWLRVKNDSIPKLIVFLNKIFHAHFLELLIRNTDKSILLKQFQVHTPSETLQTQMFVVVKTAVDRYT